MHDLKCLGLNLLEENSAGLLLISKVIRIKLPRHFLIELFRETKTNYPDFNQLINVYQEILIRLRVNPKEDSNVKSKFNVQQNSKHPNKSENSSNQFKKSFKPSGNNNPEPNKTSSASCRFCSSSSHSTINCDVYPSVASRVSFANQKGWCVNCLSGKHTVDKCPGKRASLPFQVL